MKRFSIASLSTLAVIAAIPFISELPVSASLKQWGTAYAQASVTAIAQNVQQQPQVQLSLTADKKMVQKDPEGKPQVTWQALQGKVVVQPGDVLRYTVSGANNSDRSVKSMAFTQPIPQRTVYVLNSATTANNAAQITYSIDNGKSFVAKPTVQVKLADGKIETRPAPAELYTHIRWQFGSNVNPKAAVNGAYQVQVR